jgi:hypothetical protein
VRVFTGRRSAAYNAIKRITSVHRQCGDYIPFSCLWFDQSVCADGGRHQFELRL